VAINLEFDSYEDVVAFLFNQKKMLFIETFNEIKECIKNGSDVANAANFYINETSVIINVEKQDWSTHLETSLVFFENIEDYEICIEIKELLNTL
jgi:hypothetical protein